MHSLTRQRWLSALPALGSGMVALLLAGCEANLTHPLPNAYVGGDAGTVLSCVPNLDGVIDSNELAPTLGIPDNWLISAPGEMPAVDLVGTTSASGQLTWDWSATDPQAGADPIEAQALSGKWYSSSFPSGQFVLQQDAADTLEAIYSHDSQALWLYGIASTQQMPGEGQTLIIYEQPVALYKFPFQVGSMWSGTGTAMNGKLLGLPYAGTDTYTTVDDATGTMILPDLTFMQAHRTRTTHTNDPVVGESTTTLQVSFIFECFGEIARATAPTSTTTPTTQNFTTAAEVRRLGVTP